MKLLYFFTISSILTINACKERVTEDELHKFAAIENYPDDKFLDTAGNKNAVIIVAHDDDDCAMSGTIAKLTARGWSVTQLSLQSHILEKTGKNPADIICLGNELILADGYYRKGMDTIKHPYLPIPYVEIEEQFFKQKSSISHS